MKRIFLGICLNDTARNGLTGLGSTVPGARAVPAAQLHLTIRFIGDVEGGLLRDIQENLQAINLPSPVISIKGVGHFPPRGNPKILWAGVQHTPDLILLRNRVNTILNQCGLESEQRKFHPHITLARLKNSSPGRIARFLAENHSLELPPFQASHLTLFSSILSPKGALHTIESEFPLQS